MRSAIIICLLACLISSCVQAATPTTAKEWLTVGNTAYDAKQYQNAYDAYAKIGNDFKAEYEQAMWRGLSCQMSLKGYPRAQRIFDAYRWEFPKGDHANEVALMGMQLALEQNNNTQYDMVWSEVMVRWPKSETAWAMVEITCRFKAKTDVASAEKFLSNNNVGPGLPDDSGIRAYKLWASLAKDAGPKKYAEIAPIVVVALCKMAKDADGLRLPQQIAAESYPLLVDAKQVTDATKLHKTVQDAYTRVLEPSGNGALVNHSAYLDSLAKAQAPEFLTELQALVKTYSNLYIPDAADLLLQQASKAYPILIAGEKATDTTRLHDDVRAIAVRLGRGSGNVVHDEMNSYLHAIEKLPAEQYATKVVWAMQSYAADVPNAEALKSCTDITPNLYGKLCAANRAQAALAVHDAVQNAVAKMGNQQKAFRADWEYFYNAVSKSVDVDILATALTADLNRQPALTEQESSTLVLDTLKRSYEPLRGSEKSQDAAQALHTLAQKVLTTDTQRADENVGFIKARLNVLEKQDPAKFLTEGVALVMSNIPTDVASYGAIVDVAAQLYPKLLDAGEVDNAQKLHERILTCLKNLKGGNGKIVIAARSYAEAIEKILRRPPASLTAEGKLKLQDEYRKCWALAPDALVDGVNQFVRDQVIADTTTEVWYTAYNAMLDKLAKSNNQRNNSMMLSAQWATRLGMVKRLADNNTGADKLFTNAEIRYNDLLLDTSISVDMSIQAAAGLCTLYQSSNRIKEVERMLPKLYESGVRVELTAWVAQAFLNIGTPEALGKANDYYTLLLKQNPQHTLAAGWQYRLARILELQQKPAEAKAAYQQVVDIYPESSCAYAAGRKIDQLAVAK